MTSKLMVAIGVSLAVLVASAAAAEEAPLETKSGVIGNPEPGKGLIVFYRPGSLMGAALGCTVHEGDKEVARLGSGKYYAIPAELGKHSYFTEGEAKDMLNLEVESNETYFVKCKIGAGIMAGRANLSPSDRAEFLKKSKSLAQWKGPKDQSN